MVVIQASAAPTSTTTKPRGSSNTSLTATKLSFILNNNNPNTVLAKAILQHQANTNTITNNTLSIHGNSEGGKLTIVEVVHKAGNQTCTTTDTNNTQKTIVFTISQSQAAKTTPKNTTTIITISVEGISDNLRSLEAPLVITMLIRQVSIITHSSSSSNINNHNFNPNKRNNNLFTRSTQHN